MFTEDWFVNFHGFRPSESARAHLTDRLSQILDEAPYRSNLQAAFTRKDGGIRGVLVIHSSAGHFSAFATGRNLNETANKVIRQIRKRLNRWKTRRFAREKWIQTKEVDYDADIVA
jgi:hypothetical protein